MESSIRPVQRRIYTVTELTGIVKTLLEDALPFVWISGEISNFRSPGSGHLYFTLKDNAAQIRAVMFKGHRRTLKFAPEDGQSVIGLGRISVYEPQGAYQILLEHLEPAGVGALALAFEQLKNKLSEEGLFDAEHKKTLPYLPAAVYVVTSATGAVIHDIMRVMRRRFDSVPIILIPVKVQGNDAPDGIVEALTLANSRREADVIILARGGGSLEDLSAFNSEAVARAIFSSKVPVVSAVGHETDYTIADFVADLRAPTPSAAAELVVPEKDSLRLRVDELEQRLENRITKRISDNRFKIETLRKRLQGPARQARERALRVAELKNRLQKAMLADLERYQNQAHRLHDKLLVQGPFARAEKLKARLDFHRKTICFFMEKIITDRRAQASRARVTLRALSPLSVMERGYSIARDPMTRRVLRNASEASPGEAVEVFLSRGALACRVEKTLPGTNLLDNKKTGSS